MCREAGMVEKCCAAYEECLKLDLQDSANVRGVVVSCYMDLGYAEKVRGAAPLPPVCTRATHVLPGPREEARRGCL